MSGDRIVLSSRCEFASEAQNLIASLFAYWTDMTNFWKTGYRSLLRRNLKPFIF